MQSVITIPYSQELLTTMPNELPKMRVYEWDEDFYKEIIKDHNFSFGKFNPINYPPYYEQNNNTSRKRY